MRETGKLTAAKIAKLNTPGRFSDGRNLFLQVSRWKTKSWVLRYAIDGRERLMGLGSVADVPLALARERAREFRNKLWDGVDPIDERRQVHAARRLEAARRVTFEECAAQYVAAHENAWRSAIHRRQWRTTLAMYVNPVIGKLPVADVDVGLVLKVIEPLWSTRRETASKLRGRIEAVLGWATVRGYRQGDNPAAWRGRLEHLLPERTDEQRVRHHAALPYSEVAALVADLRARRGVGAWALEFVILTAARTGEAIGAKWNEIDFAAKAWTIPALRMKGKLPHRVPLSKRALEILQCLPREPGGEYVFIGARPGEHLSAMAMKEVLRRTGRGSFTIHGLRSTFRDWAAERTNFPHEIAETALAHKVSDGVVKAYKRTDFFDRRRRLMDEWTKFCETRSPRGEVVPLRGGA